MKSEIGKQEQGESPLSIKKMAKIALENLLNHSKIRVAADIGGGKGEFCEYYLAQKSEKVYLLDDYDQQQLPSHISIVKTDLNGKWPLEENSIDVAISLEVIEHLENPRNFFRNIYRILTPGGYAFISTPNNTNFFSRLNFVFTGCHRYFKDESYPAHITALTKIEIERILREENFEIISFHYNYEDALPFFSRFFHINSPLFSSSLGVLIRKNH